MNKIVVGNLSWTNSLAYGTIDVKIFYQQGAPTKLSKPGGRGTTLLGQFNFGGG
jgi:hypothetical protein